MMKGEVYNRDGRKGRADLIELPDNYHAAIRKACDMLGGGQLILVQRVWALVGKDNKRILIITEYDK